MTRDGRQDLSQLSMMDLFRLEVETQSGELIRGLLGLESNLNAKTELPSLMRAAHSLKGAARIVNRPVAVRIAHAMEDCLTALQADIRVATPGLVDALLAGVDLLCGVSTVADAEIDEWNQRQLPQIETLLSVLGGAQAPEPTLRKDAAPEPQRPQDVAPDDDKRPVSAAIEDVAKIDVRVSSENLGRLLFMAGEGLVGSRRLDESWRNLLRLKRLQRELGKSVSRLHQRLASEHPSEALRSDMLEVEQKSTLCAQYAAGQLDQIESLNRHFFSLSHRLHQEVLDCRMRPLSDAIPAFPRMVRDIGRELGKAVRLVVVGGSTAVDRDVLERLKVPLMHLVRNAIDHGIELPQVRQARGKPDPGIVRLEARHSGGMLLVSVSDDGNGVDRSVLQEAIVARRLNTSEAVGKMSEAEVFQFLFLPGFTMKKTVTDLSGRGVGLDIVQTAIKEIGGTVRVSSQNGVGTRFDLELPLTLSLIRALLVDIAGEPYAFPLARIAGVVRFPKSEIQSIEGLQHFRFRNMHVLVINASDLMELDSSGVPQSSDLSVVVLGDSGTALYGLVVDRFLGERELVVLGLDSALGKVPGVSAGALTPDDSPLLILDVDDLLRSIENLTARLKGTPARAETGVHPRRRKRILAVDDSLTVRELERKLLQSQGYEVDTAVDGMEGWNTVRGGHYDLVVTDVDMPRMDGIELLTLIRKDPKLRSTPVMIVSYKDREEDRQRGLEAGASYYLTKGSFQDETLLQAVSDLIGGAAA